MDARRRIRDGAAGFPDGAAMFPHVTRETNRGARETSRGTRGFPDGVRGFRDAVLEFRDDVRELRRDSREGIRAGWEPECGRAHGLDSPPGVELASRGFRAGRFFVGGRWGRRSGKFSAEVGKFLFVL